MSGKSSLNKGDMLIIALVLLAALTGFFMLSGWGASPPAYAEIYIDGRLHETISLATGEQDIRLESNGGYNILRISPEGICMIQADCSNQDCLRAGTQNQPGAMIACLPHRVLVRLVGGRDTGVDAIAY